MNLRDRKVLVLQAAFVLLCYRGKSPQHALGRGKIVCTCHQVGERTDRGFDVFDRLIAPHSLVPEADMLRTGEEAQDQTPGESQDAVHCGSMGRRERVERLEAGVELEAHAREFLDGMVDGQYGKLAGLHAS